MVSDLPAGALIVTLTDDLAPAVRSINRLSPDSLCFVLPESAKPSVERDLQPQITRMPRRWDWIALADTTSFPECYQHVARSIPGLLRHWGIDPGSLVVDLTGATPAMAAALAIVTMPFTSRIVSLAGMVDGRDGESVTSGESRETWIQTNPWDEASQTARREGSELFNAGDYHAAGSVFRHIESRVSGGLKPLYHALADLAEGYHFWDRLQHRPAWDKLKAASKALEMAALFGGPPELKDVLPSVKANTGFLEKLVLDPAEVKEFLALDLLAYCQRRLRMAGDSEIAMRSLVRALEAFSQWQLFKRHRIKTWDAQPEQLPAGMQDLCRKSYVSDIDGKFQLPLTAQWRALSELGDPTGQSFNRLWPLMKPMLDAVNHAVLGHGFEGVKSERVQQLYDLAVKLTGVQDVSLPKFPVLKL
ncbi:TIGR02710 family CRISPR-associated protein [Nitrospira sp. KM1]|uniref:TIGR02710 family CRISPR-associated CARF protein n=1 Tax=Nitrospira sp. KM1 TaxID=1936990 RepID=UPI0013A76740|nr:TIGR02710 family CRISPR-associated CARF protein [Nitrospira sp. KM1]BCA55142.1 TIGR02710 family CRISPR-associated protein [Nitrospira sp. KM1]